jgi:transposase
MQERLTLCLSDAEIEALMKLEKESAARPDFRLYRRCRGILAVGFHKYRKSEVAKLLGVTRRVVIKWVNLYKESGIKGLELEKCGGSKPRMNESQKQRLSQIIEDGPEAYGFDTGIWTSPIVRDVVFKEFGIHYDASHIRRILNKLGFSCQYPRVHLAKADYKRQKQWLENEYPAIKKSLRGKRGGSF